jgi:hypothetical protein
MADCYSRSHCHLVLGIIAISRGGTVQGIMILLTALVVVPVFVFLAPILTTSATLAAAAKASEKSNPSTSRSNPVEEGSPAAPTKAE